MFRIGHGFDVHRFSDDVTRPLMLGGVKIREGNGLVGNSDADAILHAATDAVLGAIGLPDIGSYFKDTDDRWRNASSDQFLRFAISRANELGWQLQNIDCTVVAEQPKINPFREEIVNTMSAVCDAQVNVKATRAEGLGSLGRVEGIACWAVALMVRVRQDQQDSARNQDSKRLGDK